MRLHQLIVFSVLLLLVAGVIAGVVGILGNQNDGEKEAYNNDIGPRIAATCERSVASKADPIIKPTSEPPAHQHQFFGPPQVSNDTTRADLLSMSTTCKQAGDNSAWWRPEVYWGGVPLRHPSKLVIYYEITSPETAESVRPWPADFEDISRDPSFRCGNGDWGAAPTRCRASTIQIRMEYEQCLDTSDSTVEQNTVLPVRGKCPADHPLMIPKIQSTATYQIPQEMGPLTVAGNTGVSPATSMHEDFMNGWDTETLRKKVALCLRQTNQNDRRPDECRTSDREQATIGTRRHKAH